MSSPIHRGCFFSRRIDKSCVYGLIIFQDQNPIWLVVSTPLKNISQWEELSHIFWKIKNVWNHQPAIHGVFLLGFQFQHLGKGEMAMAWLWQSVTWDWIKKGVQRGGPSAWPSNFHFRSLKHPRVNLNISAYRVAMCSTWVPLNHHKSHGGSVDDQFPYEGCYPTSEGLRIEVHQWELQDPKTELLYHIKPYSGGISPYIAQNIGFMYATLPPIYRRYLKWSLTQSSPLACAVNLWTHRSFGFQNLRRRWVLGFSHRSSSDQTRIGKCQLVWVDGTCFFLDLEMGKSRNDL